MKTPLRYQATEFDCGSASIINAIIYLYAREEIPPSLFYNIIKYTLDEFDSDGNECQGGTSPASVIFLAHWINSFARIKNFGINCEILTGNDACLDNPKVSETLNNGGVLIPRVWLSDEHYVLVVKIENDIAYLFDPYYVSLTEYNGDNDIEIIKYKELEYNRAVSLKRLNSNTTKNYSIVNNENRIILLINKVKP
jgi:hypothetical protein